MHETIAGSTIRVTCGQSSGSGFIFINSTTVVTNHHVVQPHNNNGNKIQVTHESGEIRSAAIISSSPTDQFDFAILALDKSFSTAHTPLKATPTGAVKRGQRVIFAGFPHGIPHLLVHEAIVSGPAGNKGFYIDGSVNGGNSGGPIIDQASGLVVGIVTQRRFLGGQELNNLKNEMQQLVQYCGQIAGQGRVVMMGIDFGQLTAAIGRGFMLSSELFSQNANSGIGIGYDIAHAVVDCAKHGIA